MFSAVLERDIEVRMILSERVYTMKNRKKFLFSLMDLNKQKNGTFVQIKVFHVSYKTVQSRKVDLSFLLSFPSSYVHGFSTYKSFFMGKRFNSFC